MRLFQRGHTRLPLAVIPESACLEDAREEPARGAGIEISGLLDDGVVGDAKAVAGEEALFGRAVLGDGDAVSARRDETALTEPAQASDRDILEFDRYRPGKPRESAKRRLVVVGGRTGGGRRPPRRGRRDPDRVPRRGNPCSGLPW
jgi:hypothetical protein